MNKDRFLLVFVFLIVVIASVGIITYFSQNAVESIYQTTIDRRNADVDNLSIIIKEANPHLVNKAISTHYLGMHALVAILDSDGNVITSTNNTILNNISLKKLDIFKQAINGEMGSKIETIGDTKMFVSYHAIQMPTTTWALLVIRPYIDSFSAYETAKSQVIVTVVLVTLLVTIFGLYVTRAYNSINDLAKKLDIAIKELIQADKEKGEFASMVSHDLRTPAVVIKSYTGMLLDPKIYGSLNEDQEKAVQAISNSTQKLETLIDDIFDAYKLEMKSLKLEKEDIDISNFIQQTIFELTPLCVKKGVSITTNIKVKGSVSCDSKRISQVISNLIKNSLDFVPEKGGQITIGVEKDENSNAVFTISDNGPGVPQEHVEHLFKKFYQVGKISSKQYGGSGLGLSICSLLVQAHGGKIWLDTSYTEGASFKFTLPDNKLEQI
jgi:signal transduction histidine kinase